MFDDAKLSMNHKANILDLDDEVLRAAHKKRAKGGRAFHADSYHEWVHGRLERRLNMLGEGATEQMRRGALIE